MKISIVESVATAQVATVLVKQVMRTSRIFVKTCVKGSIVVPAVIVHKEFVVVMKVLQMLETFVWTCAKESIVDPAQNV